MKSLTPEDYAKFEASTEAAEAAAQPARELFDRALAELDAVVQAANGPHGGGGIIHVATLTRADAVPPDLCRSALQLITDGLSGSLINLAEFGVEARHQAYQHLAGFMVTLKIVDVKGQAFLEGSGTGDLTALNTVLAPLLNPNG